MILYKFGKSYYIQGTGQEYNALELIVVHAASSNGRYSYSYDQSRGTARDYKNMHNELAQAEKYIAEQLAKVSFRADETPGAAHEKIRKFIDSKNQYDAFDVSVVTDINASENYHQQ